MKIKYRPIEDNNVYVVLVEMLLQYKDDNNLTNKELANKIGISLSTLNNILTRRNNPSTKTIIMISKNLNISFNELLKGDLK